MSYITCKDLAVGYDGRAVASGLNFSIDKGDYLCIVGENGAGKSTLVKTLLGLLKPVSGEIKFGDDLTSRDIGYLPQQTPVQKDFPATVWEVALSGTLPKCGARPFYGRKEKQLAQSQLERLGIWDIRRKCYRHLSGGQQQRVAVARALVMNPEVLLLDEPLSNLDAKLRESVRVELRDIQKKMGLSTIYVTHDQSEALSMSDMIVVLKGGVVHQTGSPQEIYFEPKTPFVADFIGTTNLLSVKGLGENTVSYGNDRIPTAKSVNAGQEYCLSIRPECLKLVKEAVDGQVNVKVTIQNKMFLGEKIRYFVNDSLGKEWIIDIYDPGRTILEGEAYAAFPFEKAWLIEDLTDLNEKRAEFP